MTYTELTASVTAIANALACQYSDDELAVLSAALVLLGDSLAAIITHRAFCRPPDEK